MLKYNTLLYLFVAIFFSINLYSIDLINTKKLNLDFSSNINFYTTKQATKYNKNLDSNVVFAFKSPLEDVDDNIIANNFIVAVLDLGVRNNYLNRKDNVIYNKYSYIQLENSSFGVLSAGVIPSIINLYLINNTDKANTNALDAGYLFNSLSFNAEIYNLFALEKSVSYISKYNNWLVGVQYSSTGDYTEIDNLSLMPNNTSIINQAKLNYSFASVVKYFQDNLDVSFAYQRTHIVYNQSSNYLENLSFKNNNFLANISLSADKLYFATTLGYYNNLHLIGTNYVGFSTYINYKLSKIVPYIGYNLLFLANYTNNYFENLYSNKSSSIDISNLVMGLKYNINKNALIGFEYSYDIRATSSIKKSLLKNKKNNIGNIYFKFSF